MSEALPLVAARLGERPVAELGRAALRDELAAALQRRIGFMSTAVAVDFVRPQGWSATAVPVDVTVRGRIAGWQSVVCACGWGLDAADVAPVVPALLAATCAARDRGSYAYLILAGPEDITEGEAPLIELLDEADCATLPLLVDDLGSGSSVEAIVPGRLRSRPVAESWLTVDGAAWSLRAARVDPAGGDLQVSL